MPRAPRRGAPRPDRGAATEGGTMVSRHGCHSGLAAAELGGSHWSAGLRRLPSPCWSPPAPGFPWRPKPIKDTGLGASLPSAGPRRGHQWGSPGPPGTFLAPCPGLNPTASLGVCPAKAQVEGSGGPGMVELDGWLKEGQKGCGFGLYHFVGQAGTQSYRIKEEGVAFIHSLIQNVIIEYKSRCSIGWPSP